jgi:uncharacterized protein
MTSVDASPSAKLPVTTGPWSPGPVAPASMVHRWDNLTFVHWRVEPAAVQRLLPPGLTVQTHDGTAWVGLVLFEMVVSPPLLAPLPWVSRFAETNVRTYVRAADGTTGVWFLSLDAARLGAVVTARTTYRLPYYWSAMSVSGAGPVVGYRSRRRWPGLTRAHSDVAVEVGSRIPPAAETGLDHWLTARFRLYSSSPAGIHFALADHLPWELHTAELLHCEQSLVAATGLPEPEGMPVVHWSPGVEVRVGFPREL